MQVSSLHHVQVKWEFGNNLFSEGAQLLGEMDVEAPSLPEPVVVGDPCEEGLRGRFVLIQKDTGGKPAGMKLSKVLVNHTEKGETANVD